MVRYDVVNQKIYLEKKGRLGKFPTKVLLLQLVHTNIVREGDRILRVGSSWGRVLGPNHLLNW